MGKKSHRLGFYSHRLGFFQRLMIAELSLGIILRISLKKKSFFCFLKESPYLCAQNVIFKFLVLILFQIL